MKNLRQTDYLGTMRMEKCTCCWLIPFWNEADIVVSRFAGAGIQKQDRGKNRGMSSDMERFIIVVVINTLVAAGYLIWNRVQNKERPLSYISPKAW